MSRLAVVSNRDLSSVTDDELLAELSSRRALKLQETMVLGEGFVTLLESIAPEKSGHAAGIRDLCAKLAEHVTNSLQTMQALDGRADERRAG